MATMRRTSLNTVTPPKRKPKNPREKGFKEEPILNTAGKEISASRRGIKQYDRGSARQDQKIESDVPVSGMYNQSGYPITRKVKSFLGNSDYPLIIDAERKKFDAAKYGSADKQGKGQQLRRAKQEYQDEMMNKVRKTYGDARTVSNRGDRTYLKRTEKNKEEGGVDSNFDMATDQIYGANRRFQKKIKAGRNNEGKRITRDADYIRYRKNLFGRTVAISKRADFGAVVKGTGSKSKQIGDKIVTRKREVYDNTGIPFLIGKNARQYGGKVRTVSRVGTSTKKGFAAAGDTRGVVTNAKLPVTYTGEDVKTKKLASHRVVGRTNSNRRKKQ